MNPLTDPTDNARLARPDRLSKIRAAGVKIIENRRVTWTERGSKCTVQATSRLGAIRRVALGIARRIRKENRAADPRRTPKTGGQK